MKKYWIYLMIGVIFEVSWAVGMKYSSDIISYLITLIAILASFYFLIKATSKLPIGSSYAVFVGMGSLGTILVDIFIFNVDVSSLKMIFILTLIVGIVGLTFTSNKQGGH